MPQILQYSMQLSLYYGLFAQSPLTFLKLTQINFSFFEKTFVFGFVFFQSSTIPLQSTDQKSKSINQCLFHCLQVLTGTPDIQKSFLKQLKARVKYLVLVLFAIQTVLFLAFYNNPTANSSMLTLKNFIK